MLHLPKEYLVDWPKIMNAPFIPHSCAMFSLDFTSFTLQATDIQSAAAFCAS